MVRSFVFGIALLCGVSASAMTSTQVQKAARQAALASGHKLARLVVNPNVTFTVGDTASYSLSIASFSGTMVMTVTGNDSNGVTIDQKIDLSQIGQEDIVEVIDPATGQIKSITVNGQPQTPPNPDDIQIISDTKTTITEMGKDFKVDDLKIHDKANNSDSEMWVDPKDVPVAGMVKMTQTADGLPLQADLTSYQWAGK
jgi:hypothetical protein